jgi:serine/threonine protein kinase/tetratricopeptide (TPR) repeat protein
MPDHADPARNPARTIRGTPLSGRRLGVYELGPIIGAGGMAEVYAAYDPRLKRDVAIKVVHEEFNDDPQRLQRLEREARAAAALNHPNILAVHDIGTHEGLPYIVMERVRGETLARRLKRERPPLAWTLDVGVQIADALAAVHASAIVHRDLKPGNVMLTEQGRVKVLDFGLAKVTPSDLTATQPPSSNITRPGQVVGTPAYMAPEQLAGKGDYRADIYSLGVILFELVTGRTPFQGHDFFTVARNMMSRPAPLLADLAPTVPAELSELVARCLATEPSARPASAAAVKSELERIRGTLGATPLAAPVLLYVPPNPEPSRLVQVLAGTLAMGLIIAIAAFGFSRWRSSATLPVDEHPIVGILPLANVTGQASNDYLGVGISDALTTSLSKLSSVTVVSREITRESARATSDPAALARQLGVNLLVQGSLQRSGDRVRIDARLVRPDASVVWAGEAEGAIDDLFTLQRRLADRLVEALRIRASPVERQQLAVSPTQNMEALEAYWRGVALLERTDAGSIDLAITSLERAIELDSNFAVAHAGLGSAFVRKYNTTNDSRWMTQATQSATRALELDPSQTEVRLVLARVYRLTGRNGSAVEELRRVLADEPTSDEARRRLGQIFEGEGRHKEALEQFQGAVDQRPAYWLNHDSLGLFYFRLGQYQDAIRAFTRVTELRPDSAEAFQRLGTAYQAAGDKTRAREFLERAIAIAPDAASYSNLGTIYYGEGRLDEAAEAYREAIKLRPNRALYHRNLGDVYQKQGRSPDAVVEYREAARLTEDALKVNPNDARTIAQLALYEAKIGQRAEAEVLIARALAMNPADGELWFRRAAIFALRGNPKSALDALAEAVAKGFARDLIREDDDLASLRSMPAFQSLVSQDSSTLTKGARP